MVNLYKGGAFLINGKDIVTDLSEVKNKYNLSPDEENGKKGTMAYSILESHNTSDDMNNLKIKFDKLTSHDITYVGIIQTARASGLEKFPIPYVLTNCHNSLCAVGGTINEDDHMFGLSAAKKYGGIYVPPHQAVIHQFAREVLATGGGMILGSDSHTRYGALGTMAMGEGGPELVKQLLNKTYDIAYPSVVGVYLKGEVPFGVGPQDVALAIIGAVFANGYVNNKVMEFVGPGIEKLSVDFRIGIDVMTTETTCLSSIWETDEEIKKFYDIHKRSVDFKEMHPGEVAYYDGMIEVDLSKIKPMIAMPFHPSNVYTIDEVNSNLKDILHSVEEKAKVSLGENVHYSLMDKIVDGKLYTDQGIIAGCAGGGFENIVAANDILKGKYIGFDEFSLSIYPASTPIYMELLKDGVAASLLETGSILKTAFCGPCFGAGDTPANNSFSIRHSTRNFPNREGSKLQNGQIASVALMDARSIAATAANKGFLTSAAGLDVEFTTPTYHFDSNIYANRVFDSKGIANKDEELQFGPNIKDWPAMIGLTKNMLLKVVSEIHDPVTTTDELIPSGETSSYRSNPLGLAEFTLSRKDPSYVGKAKEVHEVEEKREQGILFKDLNTDFENMNEEDRIALVLERLQEEVGKIDIDTLSIGSTIFARKPGDGSAREQAASCQKVLGGFANIANEYATKRYRSNLINWGMLPLLTNENHEALSFGKDDYIFLPNIYEEVKNKASEIKGYVVKINSKDMQKVSFTLGNLSDTERQIIEDGCLINYYKNNN
ncbi:MAG: hydratase [Lachnospiraceae bacterium]|jgi:aconitate hydratase|nr:hydratase [Lachnospiraceae bacterium]